jgi:hypothetical protein
MLTPEAENYRKRVLKKNNCSTWDEWVLKKKERSAALEYERKEAMKKYHQEYFQKVRKPKRLQERQIEVKPVERKPVHFKKAKAVAFKKLETVLPMLVDIEFVNEEALKKIV